MNFEILSRHDLNLADKLSFCMCTGFLCTQTNSRIFSKEGGKDEHYKLICVTVLFSRFFSDI